MLKSSCLKNILENTQLIASVAMYWINAWLCVLLFIVIFAHLHVSTVERFLEVWIYLLNKGSVNHNKISTRKLMIERKWWKIVTKNQKKGRSIVKNKKRWRRGCDWEVFWLTTGTGSPLCPNKGWLSRPGRALPWLVFKECLPMLLWQSLCVHCAL